MAAAAAAAKSKEGAVVDLEPGTEQPQPLSSPGGGAAPPVLVLPAVEGWPPDVATVPPVVAGTPPVVAGTPPVVATIPPVVLAPDAPVAPP